MRLILSLFHLPKGYTSWRSLEKLTYFDIRCKQLLAPFIKHSPCGSSLLFRWTFWGYPSCVFFLLLTTIPHANRNNDDKHYSSYNTTHNGACVIFLLSWFCCKINKMKIKKQISYGPPIELFEVTKSVHSSRPFSSCHSNARLVSDPPIF